MKKDLEKRIEELENKVIELQKEIYLAKALATGGVSTNIVYSYHNYPNSMDINKIMEEFFQNQPTMSLTFTGKESEVSKFGYKVRRGNEIFTVVDWGNIKQFLHDKLLQVQKETAKAIIAKIPDNCDYLDVDFFKQQLRNKYL